MSQAKNGDTVKVHYTGTLDDGTIFDSSENREPLEFKIGDGSLLKMFEEGVVGLATGEAKDVKIPAAEGYGEFREDLVGQIPKTNLPEGIEPKVGMQLQTRTADGHTMLLRVTEVSEANITVDANHDLAGKDLNFNIKLVEIL